MYRWIAEEADERGIEFHWATAWQMYQAVDALIQTRQHSGTECPQSIPI
jgi:hypothetical protein